MPTSRLCGGLQLISGLWRSVLKNMDALNGALSYIYWSYLMLIYTNKGTDWLTNQPTLKGEIMVLYSIWWPCPLQPPSPNLQEFYSLELATLVCLLKNSLILENLQNPFFFSRWLSSFHLFNFIMAGIYHIFIMTFFQEVQSGNPWVFHFPLSASL